MHGIYRVQGQYRDRLRQYMRLRCGLQVCRSMRPGLGVAVGRMRHGL